MRKRMWNSPPASRLVLVLAGLLSLLYVSAARAQGRHGPGGVNRGRGSNRDYSRWVREEIAQKALWPRWFEHNREALLGSRFESRRAAARDPVTAADRARIRVLLAELAASAGPFVRDGAVLALGRVGGEEAIAPIVARLSDPEDNVAESALLALGLTREKAAIVPLVKQLRDGGGERAAWAALGIALLGYSECGGAVSSRLGVAIEEEDFPAAACLITALQEVSPPGDPTCVGLLARHLGDRKLAKLQPYLCHALGRIGGKEARKALLVLLRRGHRRFRGPAVLALSNWCDDEVIAELLGQKGIRSGDRLTRIYAATALARAGAGAGEKAKRMATAALVERADAEARDPYLAPVCRILCGHLRMGSSGPRGLALIQPESRAWLASSSRAAAVLGLGLSGHESGGFVLRTVLKRPARFHHLLHGYAALALGIAGDGGAAVLLRERLAVENASPEVAMQACVALGLVGGPEDAVSLVDLLEYNEQKIESWRSGQVWCAAAVALGILGERVVLDRLMELAARDKRSARRGHCIAALGWLGARPPFGRLALLYSNFAYGSMLPITREVMSIL